MSNAKSQAISGVSAGTEAEIMTAYPSVAAMGAGQSIGRLCDAVPLKTNGVPWPRLVVAILFWPIVVPFALTVGLLLYSYMKLLGKRYVLTNRSLEVRQMIGVRNYAHANLTDIKQVIIRELPGQAFYKAADLIGTGADGKTIIRLEGVQRPAVFRQTILEARDAKSQIEESLKAIQSRRSNQRTPPTHDFVTAKSAQGQGRQSQRLQRWHCAAPVSRIAFMREGPAGDYSSMPRR